MKYLIWLAAAATTAQAATRTIAARATPVVLAVVPTAPGQIGINPVEEDIGDPDIYRGTIIHADANLITVTGSPATTTWLAKHIDFLTEVTKQPGTTSTVQISVATAAAAAAGIAVGDVSVILAEGLANKLSAAAGAAVQACKITSLKVRDLDSSSTSLSKRAVDDGLSCLLSAGAKAYGDGGVFSIVNPAEWEGLVLNAADNAAPLVAAAFQVAKTQARKAMLALFMAAADINIKAAVAGTAVIVVGKIVIPKLGFGTPVAPTKPAPSNNCDPATAKKTIDSPLCTDANCKGASGTDKCTVDPNKGCPCILQFSFKQQLIDNAPAYFDQQQDLLHQIDGLAVPTPPKTIQNADPMTVTAPTPSPSCGSNGKSNPTVNFEIKIPTGKDGIKVNLPIANPAGTWTVGFDKTDQIDFWQIDAGATAFVPITNGNGAPPNGKIVWTVKDGSPTVNTVLSLTFKTGNLDIKATISGQQTCTPPATPPAGGGTPDSSQCISDCKAIIGQLSVYGDTVNVDNSNDLSKMVDYATGTGNKADNDWWRVSSHGNCFLMIGKDASHRGFPNPMPPIPKQQLIDFINQRVLFACTNANPFLVATQPKVISNLAGSGQVCLTNFDNYQKCTGHVAAPS